MIPRSILFASIFGCLLIVDSAAFPVREETNLSIRAPNSCVTNCPRGDTICRKSCFCSSLGPSKKENPGQAAKSQGRFDCVQGCLCPEGGDGTNPSESGNPSQCLKSCSNLPFDLNGDRVQDEEDLIFVLRAINDPLGEITPGDTSADLNEDGVVDFTDAFFMLDFLVGLNGADSLLPFTPEYDDTHVFDWDQVSLPRMTTRFSSSPIDYPRYLGIIDRQSQTCGLSSSGQYSKGSGPDPAITWDNGYPFNPNAEATLSDYWNWARYGALLAGAEAASRLPDGTKAYRRYRDGSGQELSVDYEKAIMDDVRIKQGVDAEIQAVKQAVQQMFDGSEASFSFYSTDSRLVNSATENWQKALGGHRIWSVGSVNYDAGACQLNVNLMIKVEDFYNFNNGQVDIASGLPDDDNGRFEVLGWAKSFFSRGQISRSENIPLQCCTDTDCGNATEFDCECNLCTTQCPTNQRSGGQGFTSFTVDLMKTQGMFEVFYEMYTVPDELTIYYEGSTVFTTGGLVSGSRTLQVSYGSAMSTSTVVTVEINAPRSGTAWIVAVSCPP